MNRTPCATPAIPFKSINNGSVIMCSDKGINQKLIDTVGKMGADGYCLTSEHVELNRP